MQKYQSTKTNEKENNKENENKYIMIREPLNQEFNQEQWQEINHSTIISYIKIQNKIMHSLLGSEELFNKYFSLFYENHVTLYHWYLLARENQHDLEKFIFKRLLKRTFQNYKDQVKIMAIKQLQEKEKEKHFKIKIKPQSFELEKKKCSKIEDLSQEIFQFMSTKTATASLQVRQKPWTMNQKSKIKCKTTFNSLNVSEKVSSLSKRKNENKKLLKEQNKPKEIPITNQPKLFENQHDFHQLYLETFNACDGYRYIFYNHEKHMKGLNEKDKYNDFIRTQTKNKYESKITEHSEDESLLKEIIPLRNTQNSLRSSFEFSFYGKNNENEQQKYKSQIIFRRIGSKNFGKFIRK